MNSNKNYSPIHDESMLNIRFIPNGATTRLWQYVGMPAREYDHAEQRWKLTAPAIERFCDWWREMRKTGTVPSGQYKERSFEVAQLLRGGYFSHDPNTGRIHDDPIVCYPQIVEEIPLPHGQSFYALPDEARAKEVG